MRHECDKRVDDRGIVFYDERTNGWLLELGFDSVYVHFCPFCGVDLRDIPRPAAKREVTDGSH